jgi:hypothetical protein
MESLGCVEMFRHTIHHQPPRATFSLLYTALCCVLPAMLDNIPWFFLTPNKGKHLPVPTMPYHVQWFFLTTTTKENIYQCPLCLIMSCKDTTFLRPESSPIHGSRPLIPPSAVLWATNPWDPHISWMTLHYLSLADVTPDWFAYTLA